MRVLALSGGSNLRAEMQPVYEPMTTISSLSISLCGKTWMPYYSMFMKAHTTAHCETESYGEKFDGAYYALWCVPAGYYPNTQEA